jgi:hypothetical protein
MVVVVAVVEEIITIIPVVEPEESVVVEPEEPAVRDLFLAQMAQLTLEAVVAEPAKALAVTT